ncbi:CYFA0S14e01442g1_1 [Cyberlindnera fabianii]|uniref:Protein kinase C-like 1 n=1 Tax=Cyberlindnera fabianii TaxID=36022 RepID=A0A061BBE5_CYBFA|nr:CYFA0S14e01442g1_1 [Cyberlindnera fabianii]
MSDRVAEEIKKKILRERNIIVGATNLKKKTSNSAVIQKCNSNIQEAQQNIDYLNERLNQLKFQDSHGSETGSNSSSNPAAGTTSGSTTNNNNGPNPHTTQDVNYSRLDLMKYDCPSLGHRIQYMINQLNTKLKVEQKYYEANEKLSKIYQLDGDRRISSVAEDGRIQSNHKIQLLKKSLKRYEDVHVNLEQINQDDEESNTVKFRRKPLAGTLTIGINTIRDVDHIASPLFSRKTESFISIKVDDEEKVKTKATRNDKYNEEFNIPIEKGNEVEITVFDKVSGNNYVPVAIAWFLISDIAEEIRKKKVDQAGNAGWVSAAKIQDNSQSSAANTSDNFTVMNNNNSNFNSSTNINNVGNVNNVNDNSTQDDARGPVRSHAWFVLEPAGQILLTFGFTKSSIQNKKTLLGGLHRRGAIRKREDEVFEQHGHQFVQKQFYSIMRCALCGDFLRYSGYQCQDCKFLCHKKCYEKVITKCISKSSTDVDPDELKLNHRIPHRFEQVSNKGTNWCCHCGSILPWGRKNVLKCSECDTMCHNSCSHLVPDFCGMTMEAANEILKTIKSTEGSRKKLVQSYNNRQSTASSATAVTSSSQPSLPSLPKSEATRIPSSAPSVTDLQTGYIPTQHHQKRRPPPQDRYSRQETQQHSGSSHQSLAPPPIEHSSYRQEQQQPISIPTDPYQDSGRYAKEQQYSEDNRRRLEEEKYRAQKLEQQRLQKQQLEQQQLLEKQKYELQLQQHQQQQQQQLEQQQELEQQQQVDQQQYADLSFQQDNHTEIQPQQQQQLQEVQNRKSQTPSVDAPTHTHHHERRHRPKVGLDDFHFIAVLGRGNFGKVMLGRSHRTKNLCAVKILKKDMIIENGEIASMNAEKEVFMIANREQHPFLINLHCCFQTANRIYFVMEYVSGGDLMWHVQQGNFSLRRAKFYASEVLLALKYLHENGIVYRDLKLDNILLSPEGHIKIADYGLCKPEMWYGKTTNTFCGTPEFMAPEILKEQNYTRSVDWWAFGVLVYQMLLGKSPFRGDDEDEVFNAILTDEPLFPIQMASEAVSLLESLLDKNPQTRLGSGARDAEEIMVHPYFKNIDFDDILNERVPPPYIPGVKSEEDVSFFDKDFTTEVPRLTPVNSVLDSSSQAQFRGFSYVNDASGL